MHVWLNEWTYWLTNWLTDWMKEWINERVNQWKKDGMSEGMGEWATTLSNCFFTEPPIRWGTSSLGCFFSAQPLIWATSLLWPASASSLSYFFFDLPPLWFLRPKSPFRATGTEHFATSGFNPAWHKGGTMLKNSLSRSCHNVFSNLQLQSRLPGASQHHSCFAHTGIYVHTDIRTNLHTHMRT